MHGVHCIAHLREPTCSPASVPFPSGNHQCMDKRWNVYDKHRADDVVYRRVKFTSYLNVLYRASQLPRQFHIHDLTTLEKRTTLQGSEYPCVVEVIAAQTPNSPPNFGCHVCHRHLRIILWITAFLSHRFSLAM